MSSYLGPEYDLPHLAGQIPSTSAHQCPDCGGIAYNPVCPYCEDDTPTPSDHSATTPNVPDLDREPDNAEQLAAPSEG